MLEDILRRMIKLDGPIRLDRMMMMVSEYYYANNQVFGAGGDFITAPSISPYFAHAIANWAYEVWCSFGRPPLQILELGPGDGTFMFNFLQSNHHDMMEATSVVMVERSAQLIKRQQEKLAGLNVKWQADLYDVENICTIVIANEFFDALPIRQYLCEENGVMETYIGLNQGKLDYVKQPCQLVNMDRKIDDIIEFSPQSQLYTQDIANLLKRVGGAALLIDYGYTSPPLNSTLQAIKNHKPHNLLEDLGSADWTAHVNFTDLSKVFADAASVDIKTQGEFLRQHGIEELMKAHPYSLERLIAPTQMGDLFKVLQARYKIK